MYRKVYASREVSGQSALHQCLIKSFLYVLVAVAGPLFVFTAAGVSTVQRL